MYTIASCFHAEKSVDETAPTSPPRPAPLFAGERVRFHQQLHRRRCLRCGYLSAEV